MAISRRRFVLGAAAMAAAAAVNARAFAAAAQATGLKDYYKNDFLIGTAMNAATFTDNDVALKQLIVREFNAITAENAMKWEVLRPELNKWDWDISDKIVEFGTANDMHIVGHTLVWHSQVPDAVFQDEAGKPLTRDALLARMEEHINIVVGRYKGRIPTWDVVNEAIEDDGQWRKSHWLNIIGRDYIAKAFELAHKADPSAHLMYNDYSMFLEKKRQGVVDMVRELKKQKVPIHGVGMQGHLGISGPDLAEVEKSIIAFANEGVRVHITELDVDVLPSVWEITGADIATRFDYKPEMDPYRDGLPADKEEQLAERYEALFKLFIRHRDKIDRVSTWGTSDDASWKNDFPIKGRVNYPLLFDRKRKPKLAWHKVAALPATVKR